MSESTGYTLLLPLGIWPCSMLSQDCASTQVSCCGCGQMQQMQHTLWFVVQGEPGFTVFCRPTLPGSTCVLATFNQGSMLPN